MSRLSGFIGSVRLAAMLLTISAVLMWRAVLVAFWRLLANRWGVGS